MNVLWMAAVAVVACVTYIAVSSNGSAASATRAPNGVVLVRAQPKIVRAACKDARKSARVRVTCPTLIPETRYMRQAGLWGALSFSPSIWAISFNNGDNGPGYVHWIAGGGTTKAIRRYVLGDAVNVVKGLPRLVSRRAVKGYRVEIYEYPPHPAGGPNGGHMAAVVPCGDRLVFASIHGDRLELVVTRMAVDLARRSHCP